jgi:hypothetical protein
MEVDTNVASGGGGAESVAPPSATPAAPDGPLSARDAASFLAKHRYKERDEETPADRTPAEPNELAPEANASPTEVPGETEASDPAKPSVEPPRSWSKEAKEAFKALTPEHQQEIADNERKREAEFQRHQNDFAERRKAAEAEAINVQRERQQYQQAIAQAYQAVQQQVAGQFSDIRSMEDVERLAVDDPIRYMQWDASQKKLQAAQWQAQQAYQQRQAEYMQRLEAYKAEQDAKFANKVPLAKDPVKAAEIAKKVKSYLVDELGMTEQTILNRWNNDPSFRSFENQKALYDAAMHADALAKLKTAAAKPVPQVQRPGTAPSRGERGEATVQALREKLATTGSMKDAAALIAAKRAAARR